MISVNHLTRTFGSVVAVDDLTFQVERGEVVGFLGVNGAGKTTAMRMLTGYLPASRGSISIAGFDVLRQSLEVRRRIGYLPESVPLYSEHRVREMLAFQGRLHGLSRTELRRRAPEVLERVGLSDRADQLVGTLSKGLRQRAGIAVALLPDPEVLVFDEPTSGLDPIQRIAVRELIAGLAERRTVIVSSHILPEIEAVCPRVVILHKGRMAADGRPEELVRRLGGGSRVDLEAVVPDPEEAKRLLATLPGVRGVEDRGRLGIHRTFAVLADEDVREDVGALAAARGWALRELSWRRPSLEQLFAHIAFELEGTEGVATAPAAAPADHAPASEPSAPVALEVSPDLAARPPAPKPRPAAFNLNPFESGRRAPRPRDEERGS